MANGIDITLFVKSSGGYVLGEFVWPAIPPLGTKILLDGHEFGHTVTKILFTVHDGETKVSVECEREFYRIKRE